MKEILAGLASQQPISNPSYEWYKSEKVARLTEYVQYETPVKGEVARFREAVLDTEGILHIQPGFIWDFGSGPAIDTPDMVYGSLAHDAFYNMMDAGQLSWDYRKTVDQYFRELLKNFGMSFWRRNWVYWGVRLGYPLFRFFKG